ncbi:MAG: hypothetical protein WD470_03250 [Rhodospirillaceae bacterium]
MRNSLGRWIVISVVAGPLLGFAVAWWMFPHEAPVIYLTAALAGPYYLFRSFRQCGFTSSNDSKR